MQIQDRAFLRKDYADPLYRAQRQHAFIIVVNCLHPAGTCFCSSLGTGPRVAAGFDLCITELDDTFLENTLGLNVHSGIRALRRLMYCGEYIESHALHIFMLQAPDLYGKESAFEIAP